MFAPIVYWLQQLLGDNQFKKLRCQAIAQHIRIINWFSAELHLQPKCRQTLIRVAKKNGRRLGLTV